MKYMMTKSLVLLALLFGGAGTLFADEETAIICRNVADPGLAVPVEVYEEAYRDYLEYGEVFANEDVECEVAVVYKSKCPCEGYAISTAEWSSEFPTAACYAESTDGVGPAVLKLETEFTQRLSVIDSRPYYGRSCAVFDSDTGEWNQYPPPIDGPWLTDPEVSACNKSLRTIAKDDRVKCKKTP